MSCVCEIRVKYDEGGYTNAACQTCDSAIEMLADIWRQIGSHVVSVELALLDPTGEDLSTHLIYEEGKFVIYKFPLELSNAVYNRLALDESIEPFPKPEWVLICEKADQDPERYPFYTQSERDMALIFANNNPRYVNAYYKLNE